MRKTTFRKKLALMLSAAMVFTMAAPAKPAHAAGKITFDFKTLNPSVGTIQDITITGTAGDPLNSPPPGDADIPCQRNRKYLHALLERNGI